MQGGFLVPPWSTFPQAPLIIPHGRISRVRLATLAFPTGPSHDDGSLNADASPPLAPMVYPLARHLTAVTSLSGSTSWAVPLSCPSQGREPLCPSPGVTWCGVISGITSEGIPLPSSLLRAHASDHTPPAAFGRPSDHGSVQVVGSPCWQMALPGVISAVLVEVPGPFPRGVPLVPLLVSSQRASASPHRPQGRHTQTISAMQLRRRKDFGAAVIPLCSGSHTCKTPRLPLPREPTCPRAAGSFPSRYGHVVTHHEL
jgi:hypothetical protein